MELHDQETKHVCKFCNESFSNGRVLGGHMRNHSGRNSAKEKGKLDNGDIGSESYGLRENPKKSWKSSGANHIDTVDSIEENVKCGVCSKQFGSPRSLYGHMRHHSVEERNGVRCKECGKGFRSLRCLTGHMKLHSGKKKVESRPNLVSMALSDSDRVSLVRKKKRSDRTRCNAITPNSSCSLNESVICDFDEEQQVEEVALCLMLLSRGDSFEAESLYPFEVGHEILCADEFVNKKPRREVLDSCDSDGKGQIFEDSECEEGLKVELEVEVDVIGDGEKKRDQSFQCRICNKNFGTYQALGGHQTLHRATRSFSEVKTQTGIMPEIDEADEASSVPSKNKEHKCEICSKNFESGQALGGHKRAHIARAEEEANTADNYDASEPWWDGVNVMAQAKAVVVSF